MSSERQGLIDGHMHKYYVMSSERQGFDPQRELQTSSDMICKLGIALIRVQLSVTASSCEEAASRLRTLVPVNSYTSIVVRARGSSLISNVF